MEQAEVNATETKLVDSREKRKKMKEKRKSKRIEAEERPEIEEGSSVVIIAPEKERRKSLKKKKEPIFIPYEPPHQEILVLAEKGPESKIQLRGTNDQVNTVFHAANILKTGELPKTNHLDQLLLDAKVKLKQIAENSKDTQTKSGTQLVTDLDKVIEETRNMLLEKNSDEKLQNIVTLAKKVFPEEKAASKVDSKKALGQVSPLAKEMRKMAFHLRDIALLLVSSRDFRILLLEIVDLFQTILKFMSETKSYSNFFMALKVDVADSNKKADYSQEAAKDLGKALAEEIKRGKIIPREKIDEIENRLIIIMRNISQTRRYRRGMKSIMAIVEHIQTLEEKTMKENEKIKASDHRALRELWETVKSFISEFTGRSFDLLVNAVLRFQRTARQDQALNHLFEQWKVFMLKTMKEPNQIQQDAYFRHAKELFRNSFDKLRAEVQKNGELKRSMHSMMTESRLVIEGMQKDQLSKKWRASVDELARDMFFNQYGSPSFEHFKMAMREIKTMYGPLLQETLKKLQIPRIEAVTGKLDFIIEHAQLEPELLIPESIRVGLKYDMEIKPKEPSVEIHECIVTVKVKDIQQHIEGAAFAVHLKPNKFHDEGVASIFISGMDIHFSWRARYLNKKWILSLDKTKCTSKEFKLKVQSNRHNILDKIGTSLFSGVLKKKFNEAISYALKEKGMYFTSELERKANEDP